MGPLMSTTVDPVHAGRPPRTQRARGRPCKVDRARDDQRATQSAAATRYARWIAARLWVALADGDAKPRPEQVAALNAALILLADHELAASTFAARVAASAWAGPYRVILAGLGPLGGVAARRRRAGGRSAARRGRRRRRSRRRPRRPHRAGGASPASATASTATAIPAPTTSSSASASPTRRPWSPSGLPRSTGSARRPRRGAARGRGRAGAAGAERRLRARRAGQGARAAGRGVADDLHRRPDRRDRRPRAGGVRAPAAVPPARLLRRPDPARDLTRRTPVRFTRP